MCKVNRFCAVPGKYCSGAKICETKQGRYFKHVNQCDYVLVRFCAVVNRCIALLGKYCLREDWYCSNANRFYLDADLF